MTDEKSKNPSKDVPERLIAAAGRAVKDALREHKLKGNPVATWQDGRVVWVPPDKIKIQSPFLAEGFTKHAHTLAIP